MTVNNGIFYPSVKIKGNYYCDKKKKFSVMLDLDILLLFDKKDNIFMGPINISGKSSVSQITNIKMIDNFKKIEPKVK